MWLASDFKKGPQARAVLFFILSSLILLSGANEPAQLIKNSAAQLNSLRLNSLIIMRAGVAAATYV
jgi:hypothetical protein